MSKYGKRYSASKSVVQRKAWQPVLVNGNTTQEYPGNSESVFIFPLATNSAANSSPSPTIVKFKNLKLQLSVQTGSSNLESGIVYVSFIPEGYTATTLTISQHPEWLMGWKRIFLQNTVTGVYKTTCSFSSHLARNLKSGDKIVFCIQMNNVNATQLLLAESHTCSYVVCNN